jgi:hypothetical protein
MKEPLMTFALNQQFLMAWRKETLTDRVTEIHRLLHTLPAFNFEALRMLMKHFYKVSTHSSHNKMTTSNLATCFGPTLFRTEQECVTNLYNIKFYSEIVEFLILNHELMFRSALDKSFASQLVPLKPALTMMSNVNRSPMVTHHHLMRTNTNSLVKSGAHLKPTGLKTNLMNASKISVSSDSSQSDDRSEVQLCSSMLNATNTPTTTITTPRASNNNSTLSASHQHPTNHNHSSTKENVSNFLNRLSNIPHFLVQATTTSPASSSSASSTQNIPVQLISSTPITSISHHNLNSNSVSKPNKTPSSYQPSKEVSTDLSNLTVSLSSRSTLPQYGNSSSGKNASLASPLSTPSSKEQARFISEASYFLFDEFE